MGFTGKRTFGAGVFRGLLRFPQKSVSRVGPLWTYLAVYFLRKTETTSENPNPKRPFWGLSGGSPVGWPWTGGSELRNLLTISSTSFVLISAQHTPRTRQEQKGRSIAPGHNAGGVAAGCCKGGQEGTGKMSFKNSFLVLMAFSSLSWAPSSSLPFFLCPIAPRRPWNGARFRFFHVEIETPNSSTEAYPY